MAAGADAPSRGEASAQPAPRPSAGLDVPSRADGVQLLGSMAGSGYREPPALARRGDGQTLQLTPLLYALLDRIDGRTTPDGLAEAVSDATGRGVTTEQVQTLIDEQLRPLGLLVRADGAQPEVKRADPLLRMRLRSTITDPARTRRITAPFTRLFTPVVAVPVLLVFAVVSWWVLVHKGLASATYDAFTNPGLLLLVFVLTLASAGFHEFGHAAASTRGGAAPGRIGFGLYLVWPAFFTDVSDSYRLSRWGRLRTDLGGLYFNAIVVVLIAAAWFVTRSDALLLVVATQLIMMLRQLIPVVRFDGYHILADAVGVPDLFSRIGPTLRGLLPWRRAEAEARALKPWARAVVSAWVLIVVPLLVALLVLLVVALPRLVGTAWQALSDQVGQVGVAWASGDVPRALVHLFGVVAIALPMAGIAYVLVRLARQLGRWFVRSLRAGWVRRVVAIVAMSALVAGLAAAWWPRDDRYRPVEPFEGGTVMDAVSAVVPDAAAGGLVEGARGEAVALWTDDRELPTRDDPQLALVLVPASEQMVEPNATESSGTAPTWVFPFDRPDAPRPGDNQALAVNTQDGSVLYDVAFALVWADETVDTVNEAHAYASCRDCTTAAIAFQVVLIAGQADVVAPQNLAAAVNYGCIDCVTYALASQLVLTVDGELSGATVSGLEALWRELSDFAAGIRGVPLDEMQQRLGDYRDRIAELLLADPAVKKGSAASGTSSGTPTPTTGESSNPGSGNDGDPVVPGAGTGREPSTTPEPDRPSTGSDPEPTASQPGPSATPSPPGPTTEPTPAPTQ